MLHSIFYSILCVTLYHTLYYISYHTLNPTNHSTNLLYPKEDHQTKTLKFTCRNCENTEDPVSYCIFKNIKNTEMY